VQGGELRSRRARQAHGRCPATDGSGTRSPFHLIFRGPREPVLAQQTCRLENDRIGALEVFIVPIGRNGDGADYEAIFA
jgi:hypothetical protein